VAVRAPGRVVLLFDQALSGRALRDELAGMLPVVPLASLLVEVDARTGFTGHLVHAGGQVTRSAALMWNQPLSSPAGQRLASESASSAISSASTAVRHVISAVVPTCGRGLSNNGAASGVSLDSREVG